MLSKMVFTRKSKIFCVIFFAIYMSIQVKGCFSDFDCPGTKYCCKRNFYSNVCRYGCEGYTCTYNSDCATGEFCCNGTKKCAKICESCSYDSHCPTGEFCCGINTRKIGKCKKSCLGESCSYHSDCATGESCCSSTRKCATNCLREACYYRHNCAAGEYCCSNRCAVSCLGKSCSYDSDCAKGQCCSDFTFKCRTSSYKNCFLLAVRPGENIVVLALENVPEVVLENRVTKIANVLKEKLVVVYFLANVTQVV